MAKEEQFLLLALIITLLGIAYSTRIELSQKSVMETVDETVMVTCNDVAGKPVKWRGAKGDLNARSRPQVQNLSSGTAIFFDKTRKEDTGNYTCMLIESPHIRDVFSLVVQEPLKFIDTPTYHAAREGQNVTLKCVTNLKVDITWPLISKELSDSRRLQIIPEEGLFIANVTRQDSQVYVCQAHQKITGTIIIENITLDVHHKPSLPYTVFAEEDEVYAFLNEAINLTCEVEANPPPKFHWSRRKMGEVITVSEHISVLQLNVTEDTPGTFRCTASNTLGKLEKYFDVQLGQHSEIPTNIELLEANTDSLKLKIELPDIPYEVRDPMDPQWIAVEYKAESEDEWIHTEFNITNEVILTNLSKNTKYKIQAATRNIAGLSEYYSNETALFQTSSAASVHTKISIVIYSSFILTFLFWTA